MDMSFAVTLKKDAKKVAATINTQVKIAIGCLNLLEEK